MKKSNEKYTILYARLSNEDDREGMSNSIENQRMIIEKYAQDNGFENTLFLADDGVSGTKFNRPSWNKVMQMIENDEVATIIVKDTSRLGRDYIQTGQLMEIIFPSYGVRFIAVADNVDSLYGLDDFVPFKNVIHDLYAKDCSKKVRAVTKAKAERGERVAPRPPYGYKKDPQNPKHIIPEEVAAKVVQRIFALCVEGRGPSQIARQLTEEKTVRPSNHYFYVTGVRPKNFDASKEYVWSDQSVADILSDETYLGHTINLKYSTISYKNKKQIMKPKEEWLRFENTHEPIIAQELWDMVQSIRQQKRRTTKKSEVPNMLSGLIRCADCDGRLNLHNNSNHPEKSAFNCYTYKKKGKGVCTAHNILEKTLKTIILDDLRRVTHFARQNEALFIEAVNQKKSSEANLEMVRLTKEIADGKRRETELSSLFKRLYEDNVLGKIPNEVFRSLSDDYLAEQKSLQNSLPILEQELENLKNSMSNVTRFLERAKKYTEITELSSEILRAFIEKVVVEEKAVKYSRTAPQKVWIYYRDIGFLQDFAKGNDIAPLNYCFDVLDDGTLVATKESA